MSEQQSEPSGGDGESGDGSSSSLEPGGGPQRVVSEKSVDDILSSLDETRPGSESESEPASSEPAAESDRLESEGATVAFDEDDVPEPPTESATASNPESASSDVAPDAASEVDSETEAEAQPKSEAETETTPGDDSDATDAGPSIEDAAASLSAAAGRNDDSDAVDDGSDDDSDPTADAAADLTALIEQGDVTGADVRAAEAGDGREPTPEVDEIDLSMDDLEATATGGTGTGTSGSNATDDAGPLAGSIDADSNESENENENESETDESPGLLGRIKRFFS